MRNNFNPFSACINGLTLLAAPLESSSSFVGGTKRKGGVDNGVAPALCEERPPKHIRKTARMSTGGKAPRRK